jgi:DNA polymerase-3 subunit alpha
MEMLTAEKKSLGFYITGHPLDGHLETIGQLGAVTSVELIQQETGSRATIAGLIKDLQLRTTKKGDRFAIFQLEDQAGSVKCVLGRNRTGATVRFSQTKPLSSSAAGRDQR